MAPLKFKKIVGFSSEDSLFPASNLLTNGKWKCKEEGEKQAWVCLQLEELSAISNIDIGNNGAAFVEVQVGRQGSDQEMKVILVASSFMSVNEARVGENAARVRMFGADKLATEVAKEKWDLVKVIATQPFNKHIKYGVSFMALAGPTIVEPKPEKVTKLGAFQLKAEDEDDTNIAVGSFFNRKKDSSVSSTKPSVAAAIRSEKTLAEMTLDTCKKENKKRKFEITSAAREELKKRKVDRSFPSRQSLPGEYEDDKDEPSSKPSSSNVKTPGKKKETPTKQENKIKNKVLTPMVQKKESTPKKEAKRTYGKFNEFMKGVNFTISGFQNPLRGEIRQKAMDMGARYHGDWNGSCTHLVCAFVNTPKFNQVKGKGKIVKKEWIEECFTQRKRLPWRRFCLDRNDQKMDESEDEVLEEQAPNDDYDCDTDEEIERIKREEEKENIKKRDTETKKVGNSKKEESNLYDLETDEEIKQSKNEKKESKKRLEVEASNGNSIKTDVYNSYECDTDDEEQVKETTSGEDDPYDAETDIDEDEIERLLPNTETLSLQKLPDFFHDHHFFLHNELSLKERKLLNRYIIACGGIIKSYIDNQVEFVITKDLSEDEIKDARKVNENVKIVNPKWIFKCKDKDTLVDVESYIIRN